MTTEGVPKNKPKKDTTPEPKKKKHGPTDTGDTGGGGGGDHQTSQRGYPPSGDAIAFLQARYKKMEMGNVRVTGERTNSYNCMAFTLDVYGEKLWPAPPGSPVPLQSLVEEYKRRSAYGLVKAKIRPEPGDIAVFGDPTKDAVTHVAKVLEGGRMESKLGDGYQIIHGPNDFQGSPYGVVRYYLRRSSNPNHGNLKKKNVARMERESGAPEKALGEAEAVERQRTTKQQTKDARKATGGDSSLRSVLEELTRGGHRVLVNGKRVSVAQAADEIEKRGAELVEQFRSKLRSAYSESETRKANWQNPLTNPVKVGMTSPYWLHFELNVDAAVPWVDDPEWIRCKDKQCPENAEQGG